MAKQTQNPTFTVQQSTLNKALQTCSKALSDNKILPINEYFLFEIDGNSLTVKACDMKLIISTTIEIQSAIQIKICIPGGKLLDYINKSANELLVFELDKHIVPASVEEVEHPISKEVHNVQTDEQVSYSVTIKTTSGKCTLPCEPGEDFPEIRNIDPKPFKLPAEGFLELLYKTLFAISDDQLRPVMTGLNIVIAGGKITATSTDSHRLPTYFDKIISKDTANIIIPKETLVKVKSMSPADELHICISANAIDINWGTIKTTSVLIDGTFPDYQSVIPVGNDIDFVTSRTGLLTSLKRILPFADANKLIKLNILADHIELIAENIDYSEEAKERIIGALIGEPILIGVNGNYLIAALNSFTDDKIWFSMSTPNRAIILTESEKHINPGKENLCLIMPQIIGGVK